MSLQYNEDEISNRLSRLESEYGIGYREDETVEVDPSAFEREIALARNGYLGSSYAWIVRSASEAAPLTESMPRDARDARQRVLMILGRGGDAWGIPGGGREESETFEETTRREVREETGIECTITDLFGLRYERRTAPGYEEVLHTVRLVFEAQYTDGSLSIQPGELNGAAWFATRPRRVHPLAKPLADDWFETDAAHER